MSLRVDISATYNNRAQTMEPYSPTSSITTTSSSFTNLTPPPAYTTNRHKLYPSYSSPLTLENLSKVQFIEPSNTPLARYCQELEKPSYYTESIYSKTSSKKRLIKEEKDHVLESPRLIPFPYHNDSFFLPTAEHDSPGNAVTADTTSSYVSLHTFGSRSLLRQHQNSKASLVSSIQRKASTVTPSSLRDVMVPQHSLTSDTQQPKVTKKSPWYKKLWKFLRPVKKQTKIEEPVWYSQFRSNPPPPAGMGPL